MRLLLVINHAGYFLSHRLPLALAARAAGFDVHIATPKSRHVPAIVEAGLPWHEVRLSRSGLNPLAELRTIRDLIALYRSVRPDVVHHVTSKPVLYGTIAARITKVPAVVNAFAGLGHVFIARDLLHALMRRGIGFAYRAALRHPRMRVIFQNEDDRVVFVTNGLLRAEDTVLIAGSGVDPERFSPAAPRAVAVPVVMFASRMLRTKGLLEFIDAIRILRSQGVEARYILVGDPDPDNPASVTEAELRAWAAETGAEYWGRRTDMPEVLRQADIVCLPSHREGLPKVLLEASSCAVPIVATDVPGCRHALADGVTGLLVPLHDSPALATALRRLVGDSALRRSMGEAGRKRVIEEFSLRSVIDRTIGVYRMLAGPAENAAC